MNNFALECRQLSKSYVDAANTIDVLCGVDLQVKKSEIVAIVGSSGSGKSTLLHLLGGLDKPTEGEVFIAGQDIQYFSEAEKCRLRNRHLGFVYQFHHLLPEFTALENVCMPLLLGENKPDVAKEKGSQLLDMVGLKLRLTHKVGELSGGERQRVAIARALIMNPVCVLADEPTGNLDPQNADKVFQLFLDLQKTYQTSVVIVTHDMNIANKAQRVLALENGKLVSV